MAGVFLRVFRELAEVRILQLFDLVAGDGKLVADIVLGLRRRFRNFLAVLFGRL